MGTLIAEYEKRTGATVADRRWFDALVRYKQAATSALIGKHARQQGRADASAERIASLVPDLLEWSLSLLRSNDT